MSGLPRASGSRPVFLGSEVADDLLAITMALVGELAVVRERLDTVERLLVAGGTLAPDAVEAFAAGRPVEEAREQWRRDYLDRVLYALRARAEESAKGETRADYEKVVEAIGA